MHHSRSLTGSGRNDRAKCVESGHEFNQTTQITGIVLTKLDGSGKGGIVLAIRNELYMFRSSWSA